VLCYTISQQWDETGSFVVLSFLVRFLSSRVQILCIYFMRKSRSRYFLLYIVLIDLYLQLNARFWRDFAVICRQKYTQLVILLYFSVIIRCFCELAVGVAITWKRLGGSSSSL
jgi:hypothetical protein